MPRYFFVITLADRAPENPRTYCLRSSINGSGSGRDFSFARNYPQNVNVRPFRRWNAETIENSATVLSVEGVQRRNQ